MTGGGMLKDGGRGLYLFEAQNVPLLLPWVYLPYDINKLFDKTILMDWDTVIGIH